MRQDTKIYMSCAAVYSGRIICSSRSGRDASVLRRKTKGSTKDRQFLAERASSPEIHLSVLDVGSDQITSDNDHEWFWLGFERGIHCRQRMRPLLGIRDVYFCQVLTIANIHYHVSIHCCCDNRSHSALLHNQATERRWLSSSALRYRYPGPPGDPLPGKLQVLMRN